MGPFPLYQPSGFTYSFILYILSFSKTGPWPAPKGAHSEAITGSLSLSLASAPLAARLPHPPSVSLSLFPQPLWPPTTSPSPPYGSYCKRRPQPLARECVMQSRTPWRLEPLFRPIAGGSFSYQQILLFHPYISLWFFPLCH